jgi:broad specificity phosphatase PhoE
MLDMGELHGMSISEIREHSPQILKEWTKDRYTYRWPGGESQRDKARALIPLILEIERQRFPVLVVSHASTLQVLYGYFMGMNHPVNEYYALNIPQDVVIELTPSQYGWIERRYDFRSDVQKLCDQAKSLKSKSSPFTGYVYHTLSTIHYILHQH